MSMPPWCLLRQLTGLEAAAAYIRESGIKLCALGADGEALQEVGLQVIEVMCSMLLFFSLNSSIIA